MTIKLSTSQSAAWKLAERQMRNWELSRQQKPPSAADAQQPEVQTFVAISRQVGAGGHEIAERVGELLGWPVFDRQILDLMAGEDEMRRRLYQALDERDVNWLEEMVRMMGPEGPTRMDYFHRLVEVVLALARKSHGIFLGRAADLILPSALGLRVRIIAPLAWRLERFAQSNQISENEAKSRITELESERAALIRRHFHVSPDDSERYDLVLNRERWTVDGLAQLIVAAARVKGVIPSR
ncbi:MAG: cytidylate kinase [Phycisphaerae bacterium]|nr:MAG: cytidylate kinase-like family protein [Planctomycetia bacterium]GJQ27198.1 MAG: cytidylate kinase [Phycisphaerae bacterium]